MSDEVRLREVQDDDLPILFEQQCDADANRLAAFPAREREAFDAHWAKIRVEPGNLIRTILHDGRVAGNILCFEMHGLREVGYWLGREYYGRGIATRALAAFLLQIEERPLYACVAKDNRASLRVLEKCGFRFDREEKEFATFDGQPVEGLTLKLDGPGAASL